MQRTLRMDSGNTNAVRGLANLYRQQSPPKTPRLSLLFPPASGAVSTISERGLGK
ncbi:hypothetical protein KCP74_06865 [Salmonella enterica subsp. enterica]|nr:hypothetical protein KCP74_06865 [Salmonella enterica subsp. enterica]